MRKASHPLRPNREHLTHALTHSPWRTLESWQSVTRISRSGHDDVSIEMETLTKRLAGPSTAKAGMDSVDQSKVNDIIFKASEVPGNK